MALITNTSIWWDEIPNDSAQKKQEKTIYTFKNSVQSVSFIFFWEILSISFVSQVTALLKKGCQFMMSPISIFRFIGDPVDGIPFKQTNYSSEPRLLKVPLSRETSKTNLSGGDNFWAALKSFFSITKLH